MLNKKFLKDSLLWGFLLWLFGYALGMVLFFVVPAAYIGWVITPFGVAFTIWVLLKKIDSKALSYYLLLGFIWMIMAIVLDYFLLVQLLKPADGYYKLDVYIYYIFTLLLPVAVGYWKLKNNS